MRDWLAGLAGEQYVDAILWTAAALVALAVLLGLVKIFRSLNSGTFVAGGRNRKTRLAVMDATAIDSQRRLVLIRRDDVEHLLMIGGPTDVVVEQDIRLTAQRRPAQPVDAQRVPVEPEEPDALPPAPRAPVQPRPLPDLTPPSVARPPAQPAPPPPLPRPAPPQATPRPAPEPRMVSPLRTTPPRTPPAPSVPPARPAPRPPLAGAAQRQEAPDDIDEALLNELDLTSDELSTGTTAPEARQKPQEASLDDEMARLLGELANPRR